LSSSKKGLNFERGKNWGKLSEHNEKAELMRRMLHSFKNKISEILSLMSSSKIVEVGLIKNVLHLTLVVERNVIVHSDFLPVVEYKYFG
jgi:hypothetical protein